MAMDEKLLNECVGILDTEIKMGKIRTFTSEHVRDLLEEIKNPNDCDDCMCLRTQINDELERTNFANQDLLKISRYLNNLIDEFEYSQLPENVKWFYDVRKEISEACQMLRDLNDRIRKSAFVGIVQEGKK